MAIKNKKGIAWALTAILLGSLAVVVVIFIIAEVLAASGVWTVNNSTYYVVRMVVSFADLVAVALFSYILLNHNRAIREMNNDGNARAEESRKLQFISTNYSIIDFTGNMLLYEEYKQYTAEFKRTKNFAFYLREDNTEIKDILENHDDYVYLSVKIPFKIAEGKSVAQVRISRFKFSKEGKDHRFIPCTQGSNTLILHDEESGGQVITVNLITKKGEFYTPDDVVPFRKIKLNMTTCSLLGVAVTGWTELYFTNPRKLDKGANQYKIKSSQFRISGLPTILGTVGEDI